MSSHLDRLFGNQPPAPQLVVQRKVAPAPGSAEDESAKAELFAEAAEPELYQPYLTRARPILGFAVIEKNGTLHGFQYHTMRHPKHQVRDGNEYLSLSADNMALVIEGRGLAFIFRALMRHTLLEMREFDGKPVEDKSVYIARVAVVDFRTLDEDTRADLF